jgi:hypothetical protein
MKVVKFSGILAVADRPAAADLQAPSNQPSRMERFSVPLRAAFMPLVRTLRPARIVEPDVYTLVELPADLDVVVLNENDVARSPDRG